MRRKFVAGNWKMHGSLAGNRALLQALRQNWDRTDVDVAVCVPFPFLAQTRELLEGSPISWGAQTLSEHAQGAYTGEVDVTMLSEFACRQVIVGHSERRALYGESNEIVAAKFVRAQSGGLMPILCLGETLAQRESGVTESVVGAQLDAVIGQAGIVAFEQAVLAYEPVWAIGTGRTASPDQAQAVHAFIRQRLATHDAALAGRVRILYGGSVKPGNAAELLAMDDIDGALIGGAALVAKDFLAICEAAAAAGARHS